jgi:serine/threonine protein kinase
MRRSSRATEYTKLLQSKRLWPVDPENEQNWSGRGQHAEFQKNELKLVDAILQPEGLLGSTTTAVVEKVRCKRILLARKKIRCNRTMTREKAIEEVAHLTRLNHAHLVRIIGTYIYGPELSILLYPVAEWNLETFLQDSPMVIVSLGVQMQHFIVCLSNALAFIHKNLTKHMDIKPQNILVASWKADLPGWNARFPLTDGLGYKVYIADFGIARSYTSLVAAETEGPTMFTRKYAAPEVIDYERRSFPADVFSIGCVFVEILAAMARGHRVRRHCFNKEREGMSAVPQVFSLRFDGDSSYQANLDATQKRLEELYLNDEWWMNKRAFDLLPIVDVVRTMLLVDPKRRPSAAELVEKFGTNECCTMGPEPLAAAPATQENYFNDEDF